MKKFSYYYYYSTTPLLLLLRICTITSTMWSLVPQFASCPVTFVPTLLQKFLLPWQKYPLIAKVN